MGLGGCYFPACENLAIVTCQAYVSVAYLTLNLINFICRGD